MGRIISFIYGVAAWLMFLGIYFYAIGFMGNIIVPKSIDSGLDGSFWVALIINLTLLGIFTVQHSVMARPAFKRLWTKVIPKHVERSTYVLCANLALALMFFFWQPMGGVIWQVQNPLGQVILYSIFGFGWALVLLSTFLINHFDLFGLRQVYFHLIGKEYTPLKFVTKGPYRYVRHPLYLGFLFGFWASPTMTIAHLVLALGATTYILVAIRWEEQDLLDALGESYGYYMERVPMIIPFIGGRDKKV